MKALIEKGKLTKETVKGVEARVLEEMPKYAPEIEAILGKRGASLARKTTGELKKQHEELYGPILKEMREKGISKGDVIGLEEFREAVPKHLRHAEGPNLARWAERLNELKAISGTSEDEVLDWIRGATMRPGKADVEKAKEALRSEVTGEVFERKVAFERKRAEKRLVALRQEYQRAKRGEVPETVRARKIAELEKAIERQEAVIARMETTEAKVQKRLLGAEAVEKSFKEPIHPVAREIAETLVKRMEVIYQAEQKGLALPPEFRLGYMPHVLSEQFKNAFVDISKQGNLRSLMRPEFSQGLDSSYRRMMEGPVDAVTVGNLADLGVFDPNKVKEAMKKYGVRMSADDMLLFEQDPIQAAFKRELRSVRALNTAEFGREVMESPFFLKAKIGM